MKATMTLVQPQPHFLVLPLQEYQFLKSYNHKLEERLKL
jgi:hypothetical protein